MELNPGVFLSAVFDGHGGAKTAEFAANHIHQMIKESQFFEKSDYARACVEGFILSTGSIWDDYLQCHF